MTTDAKIGLLLGLVFIVIIAFVINGLPSLHRDNKDSELTTKYINQVTQQSIGLTDAPRKAMENAGSGVNYVDMPIAKNGDNPAINADQSPIKPVNVAIETNGQPVGQEGNSAGPLVTEVPVVDPQTQKAANDALAMVTADKAAVEQIVPEQAISNDTSRTYSVRKGDTLGSIAVKFYGSEGKQKAYIDGIVKANHLKSSKQLSIDQKLIIPPPPKELDSVQPSLFEKVQAMGKRTLGIEGNSTGAEAKAPVAEKAVVAAVAPDQGEYMVQSGDYLWKIASKLYGDGNRYKDIIKCNPGVLKTKDTPLSIGMRLKMPPR